jgi:hypothetical protein
MSSLTPMAFDRMKKALAKWQSMPDTTLSGDESAAWSRQSARSSIQLFAPVADADRRNLIARLLPAAEFDLYGLSMISDQQGRHRWRPCSFERNPAGRARTAFFTADAY